MRYYFDLFLYTINLLKSKSISIFLKSIKVIHLFKLFSLFFKIRRILGLKKITKPKTIIYIKL